MRGPLMRGLAVSSRTSSATGTSAAPRRSTRHSALRPTRARPGVTTSQ
ncbi:hypothetical protein LP420_07320 [Massilia sp. B-10]|nr:hypothetical protein LP420_07320 [Massilia sp. B-10]